ncbi:MAG: ABC transporter ATP-binding protein [Candidatus Zixiibacteriota bacterium]
MSDNNENKKNLTRVFAYLKRYRRYFMAGGVAIILTSAFGLVAPWLIKDAIETLENETATRHSLLLYGLGVFGVALASGFFLFFLRRTIIWASRIIEYDLKNELTQHLLKLPQSFFNATRTGDIIARLSNDVEAVRMMIGPGIMHFANTVVAGSIALVLMLILSPKLTLYALAPFPVLAITFKKIASIVYSLSYKIQTHFSVLSAFVQENASGVRVVKAYNQEQSQIEEFDGLNKEYVKLNLKLARFMGLFQPIVALEVGVILVIVLYFGGRLVIDESLSLGVLVAFMLYLMMLVWPVMAIGWTITLYQRGLASLERIEKILNVAPEICDTEKTTQADKLEPEIRFHNLSFAYPGTERTVLHNIDVHIPAAKVTAFVGRTGCGKSTLIELMVRGYQVDDGKIEIGGRDINSIPLAQLRSMIGYVPQESFLFSDSLYENISFGLPVIDRKASENAARLSHLDADIDSFSNGFRTVIGERGVTLSGGQKQRTALARAIACNPEILILDDAFSAVDTGTEEQILTGLESVMTSRTTILVSHRISTIRRADLIYVLEEGRVVDSGSHVQLLSTCPLYADIVSKQELEEQLERL